MQRFPAFVGARLGAALLALVGAVAAAQSPIPESAGGLRLSGFGTVGLVHAEAPAGWGYRRDTDQPPNDGGTRADIDSRIGVRAQYVVSMQVDLVAQAVGRRRAHGGDAMDAIEWAYAAWRPRPDVALRVGRISQPLYLLSEYRDVGFAYPTVRPPADFYGSATGPIDGVDLTTGWRLDGAQWRFKGFGGRTVSVPSITARTYGIVLSREADGLLVRLSAGHVAIARGPASLQPLLDALTVVQGLPLPEVAAEAAVLGQRLASYGSSMSYLTVAAQFEHDDWLAMAEALQIVGHNEAGLPGGHALLLGRRFGALTLFGSVSRASMARHDRAEPHWEAALMPVVGASAARQLQAVGSGVAAVLNQPNGNQHSRSLGLRWDVGPSTALKFQTDWVHIDPNGGRLLANANGNAGPARATVASVAVDFLF